MPPARKTGTTCSNASHNMPGPNEQSSGTVITGKWNLFPPATATFSGFRISRRNKTPGRNFQASSPSPRRPKLFSFRRRPWRRSSLGEKNPKNLSRSNHQEDDWNSTMSVQTSPPYFDGIWEDFDRFCSSHSLSPHDLFIDKKTLRKGSFPCQNELSFGSIKSEMIALDSEEESHHDNQDDSDSCCDCGHATIAGVESCSTRSVRFADEEGLPIEQILHLHKAHDEVADCELVILCLSPTDKKFEFVHVGYHKEDGADDSTVSHHANHRATSVSDLLHLLPELCTDPVFVNATFGNLYRTNHKQDILEKLAVNLDSSKLLLRDCQLDPFGDIVVAAGQGCSDHEIAAGVCPLLNDTQLMKRLKRAVRSRRGLKWIPQGHTKENDAASRSLLCREYSDWILEFKTLIISTLVDGLGLFLGDDEDWDVDNGLDKGTEIEEISDHFEDEIVNGIFMVTGLTVLFSLIGF